MVTAIALAPVVEVKVPEAIWSTQHRRLARCQRHTKLVERQPRIRERDLAKRRRMRYQSRNCPGGQKHRLAVKMA